jgi:hypothetical protein
MLQLLYAGSGGYPIAKRKGNFWIRKYRRFNCFHAGTKQKTEVVRMEEEFYSNFMGMIFKNKKSYQNINSYILIRCNIEKISVSI